MANYNSEKLKKQVVEKADEILGPRRVSEVVTVTFAKNNPLREKFEEEVMKLYDVDPSALNDMRNEHGQTVVYAFTVEAEVRPGEISAAARMRLREMDTAPLLNLAEKYKGNYQLGGSASPSLQ